MRKNTLRWLVFLVGIGLVVAARADKRNYVWTYEYATTLPGTLELEYYLSNVKADTKDIAVTSWSPQLELEYGLTERWDIGLYQQFKQEQTETTTTFAYEGWKLRTRYRLAERDAWPVDLLGYLEYERPADWRKASIGEAKLVLAKTWGSFDVSYNQIMELELQADAEADHQYALGLGYTLFPEVHLGFEAKGSYNQRTLAIGPTLSLSHPKKFYFNWGVVYGMNDRSPDVESRMIVGILL